jgi:hypothetical protein
MANDSEEIMEARESVCRSALDSLRPFCSFDENELSDAVVFSALAFGNEVSESDINKMLTWATKVQAQVVMLQFVICGAVKIAVVDGQVSFSMISPDETMKILRREGIAKKDINEKCVPSS